jgi:hypothetical protein
VHYSLLQCWLAGWLAPLALALALALLLQGWLPTPSPTACRAICPEGRPCLSRLVVSVSLCLSVCPWFDECRRRRLYMPAVSLLPLTSRAVVRPLCYALCSRQLVLLLQLDNSVSSIPHTYTCTLLHPYYTRPKSCALLPSTAPTSTWSSRYTTITTYNREAMFSNCAHGRPTVPC